MPYRPNLKNASGSSVDLPLDAETLQGKTVDQIQLRTGGNLWVNPLFESDKPQLTSLVSGVTAPNGAGVNLLASRDHHNDLTAFPVIPGHRYKIIADIKRIEGDLGLRAGIWYTKQVSGDAWDVFKDASSAETLSDGWQRTTWNITVPNTKSKGCVYFQIEQFTENLSTKYYVSNLSCVDVTLSKSDVGLENVDNTSDENKPISTATQTALNKKVDCIVTNQKYSNINSSFIGGIEGSSWTNVWDFLYRAHYYHINGATYKMEIASNMIADGNVAWRKDIGTGNFTDWRTFIDANNKDTYFTQSYITQRLGLGSVNNNTDWGTIKTSNGYTVCLGTAQAGGGGLVIGEKSGQTSVQIDGDFYGQEGTKKVAYASDIPTIKSGSTSKTMNYNTSNTASTVTLESNFAGYLELTLKVSTKTSWVQNYGAPPFLNIYLGSTTLKYLTLNNGVNGTDGTYTITNFNLSPQDLYIKYTGPTTGAATAGQVKIEISYKYVKFN